MAPEIKRVVFGREDLQKSLDEIRFFLALPDGPGTAKEMAEFQKFKLFAQSGPYVRLMQLARQLPAAVWSLIGAAEDLPASDPVRIRALKIVKRWTLTKTWEKHPPEQSFSVRFTADDSLNQRTVPRTKKTPRATKK